MATSRDGVGVVVSFIAEDGDRAAGVGSALAVTLDDIPGERIMAGVTWAVAEALGLGVGLASEIEVGVFVVPGVRIIAGVKCTVTEALVLGEALTPQIGVSVVPGVRIIVGITWVVAEVLGLGEGLFWPCSIAVASDETGRMLGDGVGSSKATGTVGLAVSRIDERGEADMTEVRAAPVGDKAAADAEIVGEGSGVWVVVAADALCMINIGISLEAPPGVGEVSANAPMETPGEG